MTDVQIYQNHNTDNKEILQPAMVKDVNKILEHVKLQKMYYDKTARNLPVLMPNGRVKMRSKTAKEYNKEDIVKRNYGNPKSYIVASEGKEICEKSKTFCKSQMRRRQILQCA